MKSNLDSRNLEELNSALALARHTVYKDYVDHFNQYPPIPPSELLLKETPKDYIRMLRLKKLTCKKDEDIFQKLSTVYHAAMSMGSSLFVMVDVGNPKDPANIYLGIREPLDMSDSEQQNREKLRISYRTLQDGLESNFPGSRMESVSASTELPNLINDIFQPEELTVGQRKTDTFISSVTCVAAIRDKSKTERKGFIQGLEKLIDVMRGKSYTALFIADPISPQQRADIRGGYEMLYGTISPFRKSTWSYQENESLSVMESLSNGITESISDSVTHTQSHTVGQTKGTNNSIGIGISLGGSGSSTSSASVTDSKSKPTGWSRFGAALSGVGLGALGGLLQGTSVTNAVTSGIAKAIGLSAGLNANYSHGWFKSQNESDTTSDGTTSTKGTSTSNTTTKGTTDTSGTGRTLQIEHVNKAIEEMLSRIEAQLIRTKEGEDYGAYNCGAYFISRKPDVCLLAANTYRALLLGEGSSVENGAVNVWHNQEHVDVMKQYLRRFAQPVFACPIDQENCMLYSPGTIVSGLELPLHLGLPTKSVDGLAVVDHAEFGRNPPKPSGENVPIGKVYHMGDVDKGSNVLLDKQALTAHTFITGSTGSGKSNTIYTLLNQLCIKAADPVKFLVIESAKGEYKNVFGGYDGVHVYGSNPKLTQLLRLNPFSFPDEIHVLEHIDRLVEVFNACWPMYAAMPAVLKDAIESAYVACGWNLTRSECMTSGRYPTFVDILNKLPEIMAQSAYSADTKGDYTGALVTRIKSLTNGINGQIFCTDEEIPDADLFDTNVIVDLSRIGSIETKSLLMGILMIKLQEYRMAKAENSNEQLRHITVLEEAHNLLRRTSSEQSQESSNLQGKSVEMLANAIAEMRTYGEGFVIADQSPGLLDMAVIRNTNTKIIMRLPDESDRQLVGRAAGLNDDQIVELTKLERGVAAIHQNDWLEPVLCKVDRFVDDNKKYTYQQPAEFIDPKMEAFFRGLIQGTIDGQELHAENVEKIRTWIERQNVGKPIKENLLSVLEKRDRLTEEERRQTLYCVMSGKSLLESVENVSSPELARDMVDQKIIEVLNVSESLAMEIRKQMFRFAAGQMRADESVYRELLTYGEIC